MQLIYKNNVKMMQKAHFELSWTLNPTIPYPLIPSKITWPLYQ